MRMPMPCELDGPRFMTDETFWSEVSFAQSSPKLFNEIDDFRKWMNVSGHLPVEVENALREYWGMNEVQVDAWTRWYFAAHFGRDDAAANMLKAHAIDVTLGREPWPARFELYRYAGMEE